MTKDSEDVTTEEWSTSRSAPPTPESPRYLFTVGDVRYEAVRELETRASGEVLLQVQRRVTGESLSGPCLVRRLPSPTEYMGRKRLAEEMQLALGLNHPGIAQIFHLEFDEVEDAPYVVMEYVDGPSLETLVTAAVVRGKPLSVAFGLYAGAEVADALHYAHTLTTPRGRPLGIIHRDVSPRHIVVGQHGEVKLLDFGSAYSLLVGREESPESLLRGDVAYVSPEYLRRVPLTPRSDVFSLGVLLVEVLTGQHLFDVQDVPPQTKESRLRPEMQPTLPLKQMEALMDTLDEAFVERAVASLPGEVKAVLHTALRLNPEERFASAAEMRDALRGASQSLASGPYGRAESAREAARVVSEGGGMRDKVEFGEAGLYPEGLEAHELVALKKV
ncbi:serine/threonine protein kinase [Myxococcus sp. K15C18031901]|uniref:serine/threonine protein kinase n=1 Tax=Myxococcus dinghuensis TaxID=2906761 RepID=UPI0020A7AF52|nr:serine/threonine-protein kinase [Myxococcus dinghuensis]MCP3105332.1 serine/threonine protein kinase [Myxococcus dinghuensis]